MKREWTFGGKKVIAVTAMALWVLGLAFTPASVATARFPNGDDEGMALLSLAEHLETGESSLKSENSALAAKHFEWALKMEPRNPTTCEWLSKAYEAEGRKDLALYYTLRARDTWVSSGRDKGELKKALKAIDRRISSLSPEGKAILKSLDDYIDGLDSVAKRYFKQKFYRSASDAYGLILDLDPNNRKANESVEDIQKKSASSRAAAALAAKLKQTRSPEWIARQNKIHKTWSKAFSRKLKNYQLKTNAGYDVYQTAAAILDPMNQFYRKVYRRPQDTSIVQIHIYGTREDYVQSRGGNVSAGVRGHFSSNGEVVTYDPRSEGLPVDGMWRTMFHELSHQFLRTVTRGNSNLPMWLNEGLACFFEGCEIQSDGTIETNRIPRVRIRPLDMAFNGRASLSRIPLRRLLTMSKAGFDVNCYNHSWGLLYYLRNAEDENGDNLYHDALESIIESYEKGGQHDAVARFEEHFVQRVSVPGIESVDDFEAAWLKWIKELIVEYGKGRSAAPQIAERAKWYREKGKLDKSEHSYLKATDFDPTNIDYRTALADTYLEMDNQDEALHHLRKALKITRSQGIGDTKTLEARIESTDPLAEDFRETSQEFTQSMLGLSKTFESTQRPLCALYVLDRVSTLLGDNPEISAMIAEVETSSNQSLIQWRWLFQGSDLSGWAGSVEDVDASDNGIGAFAETRPYQVNTIESFSGDFRLRARVRFDPDTPSVFGFTFGLNGPGPERIFLTTNGGSAFLLHFDEIEEKPVRDHRGAAPPIRNGERLTLDVKGDQLTVLFEDRVVLEHTLEEGNPEGRVGLRFETGEVRFEEIEVFARE